MYVRLCTWRVYVRVCLYAGMHPCMRVCVPLNVQVCVYLYKLRAGDNLCMHKDSHNVQ